MKVEKLMTHELKKTVLETEGWSKYGSCSCLNIILFESH